MDNKRFPVKFKERDISQLADSLGTQNQNTQQNNINIQKKAVAIATNGSLVAAIQTTKQKNQNKQVGDAITKNYVKGHQKILKRRSKASAHEKDNTTTASVVQNQYVEQANVSKAYHRKKSCEKKVNTNTQSTPAKAVNGDEVPKTSVQAVSVKNMRLKRFIEKIKRKISEEVTPVSQNKSVNNEGIDRLGEDNKEKAMFFGPNQKIDCCPTVNQRALALSTQIQDGNQTNYSLQSGAAAIAVGPGSFAGAFQIVQQQNFNDQNLDPAASNVSKLPCCDQVNQSELPLLVRASLLAQQSSSLQAGIIAISINGGFAQAGQSSSQTNDNDQAGLPCASNDAECGSPGLTKANPIREDKKAFSQKSTEPIGRKVTAEMSEMNEKAVIAINKGNLNLKIQITPDGAVHLNGNKVELANLN